MEIADILINVVLALIMFGIGSSLQFNDFRQVFQYPRGLLFGLGMQMVFLPLFAFGILWLADLNPYFKMGIFVLALCPGGTTSNFINYLLGTKVALSISLTSINSLLILGSIPLLAKLGLEFFLGNSQTVSLPVLSTIGNVLLIVLLPAILGVFFHRYFTNLSEGLQKPLKYINVALLAIVFAIKFFADGDMGGTGITRADIFAILPYALLVHLGSMLGSYVFARLSSLGNLQSTTIGIEVGLQNTALALLVTSNLLAHDEITKPILVYALFSFFTSLLFGFLAKRYGRRVLWWKMRKVKG